MKKSKLRIITEEGRITIKKKVDLGTCIIFAVVFLCGVLLPLLFEGVREVPIFWVVYTLCMLGNVFSFSRLLLGKIVIDSAQKELSIHHFRKATYRFDAITDIKSYFKVGDPDGGMDEHKIVFTFSNGRKSELRTTSTAQTEELVELVSSIVFATEDK